MWKLKLVSKAVGGPDLSSIGGKASTNYAKYARFAGGATAILMAVLGLIGIFVKPLWTGIYSIIAAIPIVLLEFPFAPLPFMRTAVNFMNSDYRYRIPFYIVIALPDFFNIATVIASLACLFTGGFYGFCWFKGEKGEDITPSVKKAPTEMTDKSSEEGKTEPEVTNNKKKFSLSSLGI